MSPVLNGSSAIRHFEGSDAIEIRNGITFDFYTGLPHTSRNEDWHSIMHALMKNVPQVFKSLPDHTAQPYEDDGAEVIEI